MGKRVVIVAIAIALVASMSAAGAAGAAGAVPHNWHQANPAVSPPARFEDGMVWDAALGKAVLFGGCTAQCFNDGPALNDTWEWDGTNWTDVSTASAPSPRGVFAMAYDAATKTVVLFGGYNDPTGQALGDTWTFDGTWKEESPPASPSPRWNVSMAYDPATRNVVLFGGYNDGTTFGDTWTWNGRTWTQQSPPQSPPARYVDGIAYDARLGAVVVYGGVTSPVSSSLSDTWQWNGVTWSAVVSAGSPGARCCVAMDQSTGVMFGDDRDASTWVLCSNGWKQWPTAVSPTARYYPVMVRDTIRHNDVMFGGIAYDNTLLNDTWILK